MAKRIQRKRTKGWRMPAGAIYVGRPTRWGNPFNWQDVAVQPGYETAREIVVVEYRSWLEGVSPYGDMLPERRQWILNHLDELRGRDLACWCPPGEACHADVLIELANRTE